MTPDLALTLSFEGIGLLTRVPGGWHLLGDVTLDNADLAGELAKLRAQAVEIGGEDFATYLVLPNDQIKYLTLPAGRMGEKKRRLKAEEALEEATPYRADQLVYDLTVQGRSPQVAAVARETLAEAEAFAVEHAFNPIGFTAIPPQDSFAKAPNFGSTEFATAAGLKPNHDPVAIEVVGQGPLPAPVPSPEVAPEVAPESEPVSSVPVSSVPVSEPVTNAVSASTSTADPKPTAKASAAPQDTAPAASEDAPVAPVVSDDKVTQTGSAADTDDTASTDLKLAAEAEAVSADKAKVAPEVTPDASTSFASIRAQKTTDTPTKSSGLGGATRAVSGTNAPSIPAGSNEAKAPPLRFDPAKAVAGLKADSETAEDSNPFDRVAESDNSATTFASARSKTIVAGPAPKTAQNDRKPRGKKAQAKAANVKEKQKLTLFGARADEVRGKPRHLGLILTTLLLVFLAVVAIWASVFLEDGVAGLFGDNDEVRVAQEPAAATEPDTRSSLAQPDADIAEAVVAPEATAPTVAAPPTAATDEIADAAQGVPDAPIIVAVPEEITPAPSDVVDTALLEPLNPDSITDSAEIEAMMDDVEDGTLDPVDAEARYAVTGVWQRAPEPLAALTSDSSDDIYIASVDRDTFGFDAVALPAQSDLATDLPARLQSSPAAADTVFDLDDRGLVVATVDGALTPDGVKVFLGKPPVVPAAYPKRIKVGQEPQISAADSSRLAGLRPKLRPSDLLEQNERATLGGLSRAELASMRPKLRPKSAKQADEKNLTPTGLAVATSPRPRPKPANIAQLAARALPDTTRPATVAVPAAAAVVPDIPTTASVARQATIKNAINLNKVNLIGVYGTASNRRALVRLSSGRYKKVQVGDRVDGGKVSAIGEDELHYTKSGRKVVLKMPKG